jgi:hypothetical protein
MKTLWHSWKIRVSGETHDKSQNSQSPGDFKIQNCRASNMEHKTPEFDMSSVGISKGAGMQHNETSLGRGQDTTITAAEHPVDTLRYRLVGFALRQTCLLDLTQLNTYNFINKFIW